jgi:hypothetical protein
LCFKKWNGVAWTGVDLAKDMNRWQALVDAVMNLQVPEYVGVSLPAEDLLAPQEGLCSIELFNESIGITVRMHEGVCGSKDIAPLIRNPPS